MPGRTEERKTYLSEDVRKECLKIVESYEQKRKKQKCKGWQATIDHKNEQIANLKKLFALKETLSLSNILKELNNLIIKERNFEHGDIDHTPNISGKTLINKLLDIEVLLIKNAYDKKYDDILNQARKAVGKRQQYYLNPRTNRLGFSMERIEKGIKDVIARIETIQATERHTKIMAKLEAKQKEALLFAKAVELTTMPQVPVPAPSSHEAT